MKDAHVVAMTDDANGVRHRISEIEVHLVTAPVGGEFQPLLTIVNSAVSRGLRLVQHRSKRASTPDLVAEVRALIEVCRPSGAYVIVNDRLDVALAAGADGVHLGANDLPWSAARRLAPPPFLLGCTAASPQRIARALAAGADYVGAGPAYPTRTKSDTGRQLSSTDYATLAACCRGGSPPLPLVAIGGIGPGRARDLITWGATAVAVSSAVLGAADPGAALSSIVDEVRLARRETGR